MAVITVLKVLLCFTVWLLLTADLRTANVLFGLLVAMILSRRHRVAEPLKDWLHSLWRIVIMIPQAYFQAFDMILRPHRAEEFVKERVKAGRTAGLIFLDILIISFTPKTIVTRYDAGHYELHRVKRGIRPKSAKR